MNRTHERGAITKARRLTAIPDLLRLKPRTTGELAQRFDVPVRTIQRDLEVFKQTLASGLGHAKALGFGLLSVARRA